MMKTKLPSLESVLAGVGRRSCGGDDIAIRPIRPDDGERLVQAFSNLEQRSIYRRFFFHKRNLSESEVRYLTQPVDPRNIVLVATVERGNEEVIVGLGQCVRFDTTAEIAFVVEEDFQGRGIATRLLQRLACIARTQGISRFEADVLAENQPMLAVFRNSGLTVSESQADGVVHVTLALDVEDPHAATCECP